MLKPIAAALLALSALLAGCQTVSQGSLDNSRHLVGTDIRRLVVLPFENTTTSNSPAAGAAVREALCSALAERSIRFTQTEETLLAGARKGASGGKGLYPEILRATGARYFITGTVHEYRYMADLEGSPAVGFSVRLVDARDGRTLWHGTASNTGYGWKSLSELCTDSARAIAAKIPLEMRDESEPARVCLRTGKPAVYTPTGKPDTYEVDTLDGSLAYTVVIRGDTLPGPPRPATMRQPAVIIRGDSLPPLHDSLSGAVIMTPENAAPVPAVIESKTP